MSISADILNNILKSLIHEGIGKHVSWPVRLYQGQKSSEG